MNGQLLLAGGAMGKPADVVDAGTRLMADESIVGRALAIGPKVKTDDDMQLLSENAKNGKDIATWEIYAHDYEEVGTYPAPALCPNAMCGLRPK